MKKIPSSFTFIILGTGLWLSAHFLSQRASNHPVFSSKYPRKLHLASQAKTYGELPMRFEVNKGQTDAKVKFFARGNGYTVFLTPQEMVLSLRHVNAPLSPDHVSLQKDVRSQSINTPSSSQNAVLRMKFLGSRSCPKVFGQEKLSGNSSYFKGGDSSKWHTSVSSYRRTRYRELYDGIDVVYYGNQGQLEYDFVVAPGANPGKIRLGFEGIDQLRLDQNGDLLMKLKGQEIRQNKPFVYQSINGNKKVVEGNYKLHGNHEVSFELAAYDSTKPLVIDPVICYSTYLGGNGIDNGNGIAVDSEGNAYITGYTTSLDFPATELNSPFKDAFVTKVSKDGTAIIYSTYIGGSDEDGGFSIAVDAWGNAYVTGYTFSSDFPLKNPVQFQKSGDADVFVTKLNTDGTAIIYSTFLGGNGAEQGNGIAVDAEGNACITGTTTSLNFPLKNAIQPQNLGSKTAYPMDDLDAFVTKIAADGTSIVYSTYLGGSSSDYGWDIAVSSDGTAYVVGATSSFDFPINNATQNQNAGDNDAFITKINAKGNAIEYSTYLGGSDTDYGKGIALDSNENVYITGNTASLNFPTKNAIQSQNKGPNANTTDDYDAFIAKVNTKGSGIVYSTYLGGGLCDTGSGIAVDSEGNAYATGGTYSPDFPVKDSFQPQRKGTEDLYVTKINATGSDIIYSSYLGGSKANTIPSGYLEILSSGSDIALDSDDSVYLTGRTATSDFPIKSALQPQSGGVYDAIVVKITKDTTRLIKLNWIFNPWPYHFIDLGDPVPWQQFYAKIPQNSVAEIKFTSDASLQYEISAQARNGTVVHEGNLLKYEPRKNFIGQDSFKIIVSDKKNSAEATATITVNR